MGFNPCFNGSVERGFLRLAGRPFRALSFNPCFNGSVERGAMGLEQAEPWQPGFNPCFNGSVERGFEETFHHTDDPAFQSLF